MAQTQIYPVGICLLGLSVGGVHLQCSSTPGSLSAHVNVTGAATVAAFLYLWDFALDSGLRDKELFYGNRFR